MSIFSNFKYHPDYFDDKTVIYHQDSGLSEVAKTATPLPTSHSLGEVVRGFEAEKIEAETPKTILQYLQYTQLFIMRVLRASGSSIDTSALEQKRSGLVQKLFTEEKDTRTAELIRKFLLTGSIEFHFDNIFEIAEMAKKYQITSLTFLCDESKMVDFVGENLMLPITADKIRWMIKVDQCGLEKTKQRILSFWNSSPIPASDLKRLISSHLELCGELARRYPCETIANACHSCYLALYPEALKKSPPFSEVGYCQKGLVQYLRPVVDILPAEEQKVLDQALSLGFNTAAEEIFLMILQRACVPCLSFSDQETHSLCLCAKTLVPERLKILSLYVRQMANLFPANEVFSLLNQLFNDRTITEEEKMRIFVYAISTYFTRERYLTAVSYSSDRPSLDKVLDIIQLNRGFAQKSTISKFKEYVSDPGTVAHATFRAALGLEDEKDKAEQRRLIERIRKELYPQIPIKTCEYSILFTTDVPEQVMTIEKIAAVDLHKTEFGNEKTSDLTLKLPDGQKLFVHKTVLSRSPYFVAMVNFKEASQKEIVVQDLLEDEIPIFIELIQYLYTNKLQVNDSNGCAILRLAQRFQIEPLLMIISLWCKWVFPASRRLHSADAYESCLQATTEAGLDDTSSLLVSKLLESLGDYVKIREMNQKTVKSQDLPYSQEEFEARSELLKKFGSYLITYTAPLPASMLPELWKTCPNIKHLCLHFIPINAESMSHLSFFKDLTTLSSPFASKEIEMDLRTMQKLLEQHPTLETLSFTECKFIGERSDLDNFMNYMKTNRPHLQLDLQITNRDKKTGKISFKKKS